MASGCCLIMFPACACLSGRGPRDEPARHDGGSVTRLSAHHEGRSGRQQGARHVLSLLGLRSLQLLQERSR
jgi:hypothetical protein